jgi:oxygen-independent coproporphyrinogen-3 oxidase
MNRAHNSRQARECLEMSLKEFDNITIDLIYGSPLLSDEMWKQNVDTALALGIPHLSCYALTVEEKTPLHKMILKAKTKDVEGDKQARQFLLLMQWLREKKYEHYEVSNFALPGYRSRHNSSYWKGKKYLGIGPSAHSYNGKERRWNIANNQVYLRGIEQEIPERSNETLTDKQKLNEYIMISLRTMEGMDLKKLEAEWGSAIKENAEEQIEQFRKRNLLTLQNSRVRLTDEGMLMADGIASEMFSV